MILLGTAMLVLPRRYVITPMLILACFISPAQRIVFATLDFNLIRIMVLFGWSRIILGGDFHRFRWTSLDKAVVLWAIAGTTAMTLLEGTLEVFINRLGMTFDAIGMYFLFRIFIRDWEDVEAIIRAAAIFSIPVATVFLIEQATGRNMFSVFGGVPEITVVRDGRLRCRGPFPHPILAGCFWAALIPLICSLWWSRKRMLRWMAPVGAAGGCFVIMTTASATPLSSLLVGVIAAMFFPLRRQMMWIRWGALLLLVLLHFVMVNPVWHLLARVDIVSGSTGWYRYKLVDEFINHFYDWWLLGTNNYVQWWQYEFNAVTNQYVAEGIGGGLVTLLLFITIIVLAFRAIGRIARSVGNDRFRSRLTWTLGVSLFIHCTAFFGVSYFGQITMLWFLGLAMIESLAVHVQDRSPAIVREYSPRIGAIRSPHMAPSPRLVVRRFVVRPVSPRG